MKLLKYLGNLCVILHNHIPWDNHCCFSAMMMLSSSLNEVSPLTVYSSAGNSIVLVHESTFSKKSEAIPQGVSEKLQEQFLSLSKH